ncbi:MAG: hypothetical protein JWM82_1146 [Myxococcales bacterium]|nr:hypothetical protein [Myxococcales bacterium]
MTDARKLLATRAIRGLADGVVSVALGPVAFVVPSPMRFLALVAVCPVAVGFVLLTANGCGHARPATTTDSGAPDSGSADAIQPDADAMAGETGDAADTSDGATDASGADGEVSHSCVSVTGGGKEPWPDLQITGSQFDAYEGRRIRILVSSNPGGRLGVAEATIASGVFELTLLSTFNYGYYTEIDLYIDDNANSACDIGEPLWGRVTGIVQENLRVDATPAGLCLSGGGPSMFQGCASWATPGGPCFINGEVDLRMRLPCPP